MTGMRGVIGQRVMLERLGARASRGDVAHAYGIFGPASIGKRTIALRLAQTLNCLDPKRPAGGCGTCLSCTKIERNIHPDVLLVERDVANQKLIDIERIRDMQRDLSLRPLEGRARVVIIDDAAELSEPAQVALLKTLEEPPRHAVLLLLTLSPESLFETIRSRLQPLMLRSVATAEIGKVASKADARELVDATLLVQKLRRDLFWNANARAMLEILALRLPYVEAIA